MITTLLLATLLTSPTSNAVKVNRDRVLLKTYASLLPDVVVTSPQRTSGGGGGASASSSSTWTASQTFNDDIELIFGTGSDASIAYNTTQTPDALFIGVGQDSRCLIIGEKTDKGFDFAHAQNTNPCVWIQSANQSTSQSMKLEHDGTSALIRSTGALSVIATPVTFLGLTPGATLAVTSTTSSVQMAQDTTGTGGAASFHYAVNGTRKQSFSYLDETTSVGAKGFVLFNGPLSDFQTIWVDNARTVIFGNCVVCASPSVTTIKGAGASGTNIAAADLILGGGAGTGTGAGGNIVLQATPPVASGTTAQTLTTRHLIVAKPKTLTSDTDTTVFTVTGLGAHVRTGGSWEFCVEASDGTNDQNACCRAQWAAVDTTAGAGGEVCGVFLDSTCTAALEGAASSGTLAVTVAATTGTDTCNFRLNGTSSLTETTLQATYSVIKNGTSGTLNPQ